MSNAQSGLEEYIGRLREHRAAMRSVWENDEAFIELATTLWPTDMEGSILGRESNRSRMRLRYEGYQSILNARAQVEALQRAAAEALDRWGKRP